MRVIFSVKEPIRLCRNRLEVSHHPTTSITHAVKAEIRIFPDKSFFFNEIEYKNKEATQITFAIPRKLTCVFQSI